MLRIRLSRVGKSNQPSFRLVVAEHARPVKGKYIENMGFYNPIVKPKILTVDQVRIQYWMSKGAQPSSTVASLLKTQGMQGMEKWIEKRVANMKKRKEAAAAPAAPVSAPVAAPKETAETKDSTATPAA